MVKKGTGKFMANKMKNMELVNENNFSEFAAKVALDDFRPVKNRRLVVDEEPVGKNRETRRNRRRNARAAKKHEAEVKWFKKNRNAKQERGTDNCGTQYVVTPIVLECGVGEDGVFHFKSTSMVGSYVVNDRHNREVSTEEDAGEPIDYKFKVFLNTRRYQIAFHTRHGRTYDEEVAYLAKEYVADTHRDLIDPATGDVICQYDDSAMSEFRQYGVDAEDLWVLGYSEEKDSDEVMTWRNKAGYYDRRLRLDCNPKFLEAARRIRLQREIDIIEDKKRQLLEEYAKRISTLNDMIRRREQMMK